MSIKQEKKKIFKTPVSLHQPPRKINNDSLPQSFLEMTFFNFRSVMCISKFQLPIG